jgi:hypothetical protein
MQGALARRTSNLAGEGGYVQAGETLQNELYFIILDCRFEFSNFEIQNLKSTEIGIFHQPVKKKCES